MFEIYSFRLRDHIVSPDPLNHMSHIHPGDVDTIPRSVISSSPLKTNEHEYCEQGADDDSLSLDWRQKLCDGASQFN